MQRRLITTCVFAMLATFTVQADITRAEDARFPDFGYMMNTDNYHGRLFKLSQEYPEQLPSLDKPLKKILHTDFKKNWKSYALQVRDYVLAGNIPPLVKSNDEAFFVEDNPVRHWFHPPWLHWGGDGSEGFHGLQRDAKVIPHLLSNSQHTPGRIYSVSLYNERGGYVVGQVWPKNQTGFDLSYFKQGKVFPDGTVMVALAFTTAKPQEVSFLSKPIQWQAYTLCEDTPGCHSHDLSKRVVSTVSLIQMDVMVKDSRAKDTGGWVFTAFLYNGERKQANPWHNLTPIGLAWGNDPQVKVSQYHEKLSSHPVNHHLKTTIINQDGELPDMRLGFGGRFNGMFNGSKNAHLVSCASCHTASQFPTLSHFSGMTSSPQVLAPKPGLIAGENWMHWFQDLKEHETLDKGTVSTDKSMLILKGIYGYLESMADTEQGKSQLVERSVLFKSLK